MNSVMSAIQNTISISLFNRGLAGKIFADVRRTGAKVVMKNNAPEVVILSPDEYVSLVNEVNDARLLMMATERMSHYDPATRISSEELDRQLGITEDDLAGFDEVEFE